MIKADKTELDLTNVILFLIDREPDLIWINFVCCFGLGGLGVEEVVSPKRLEPFRRRAPARRDGRGRLAFGDGRQGRARNAPEPFVTEGGYWS